ncbi:peptidyl-prolyl cis-trans isomerase CYP18-2 isoform X2 [Selaginella moellendorffii]|uniref:peptidyl-prolyl cis-trans isomerase CYP18-2 isoform X2 n=1 Tax=Selaginella moellendorffii TaxID=88036 RepID=UPI000D1C8848|nr:peptidyl-prolyl cis-trans isomerase CYP18-2 isoform X2 [Selaginella moellendorffii]|eukprot:XP_024516448.1 peptidyl-prolyl cis-trans isomerase CYP18-2 isoform X2 [Selaginella moellendorffii]
MEESVAPLVTLDTSMGSFTLELYHKHAPKTCRNFSELARQGYYDQVKFHRVIKDFMIQGGDPSGTGRGGESIYGRQFEDELTRELKHTGAGVLSMANSGPNTNGSQFFITLAPTPWLDGKHTIFGRVCKGMDVIKRLGNVHTDKSDRFALSLSSLAFSHARAYRPVHDVKILKATVVD